jgi:hypothetical protein
MCATIPVGAPQGMHVCQTKQQCAARLAARFHFALILNQFRVLWIPRAQYKQSLYWRSFCQCVHWNRSLSVLVLGLPRVVWVKNTTYNAPGVLTILGHILWHASFPLSKWRPAVGKQATHLNLNGVKELFSVAIFIYFSSGQLVI